MQTNAAGQARGRIVGSRRRYSAWALLIVGLPLMTFVLQEWRTAISLESTLLLYLTLVVVISALGGLVPGLLAAVAADLLVNYFLIPPYGTLLIESRDHLVAILVFIAVAAVVSVLVETKLTAAFGKSGGLTGFAGCNDYNASYKASAPKISIGPVASTRKYCEQPAGVSEQETSYLAALETAATYRVEGSRLELRTTDGALAVELHRK